MLALGQHLAGKQCAHRVGNGVVNVKQIELVIFGHLGHARSQGEIVGRVLEEGIIGDRHFVIENTFFAPGEPERLRIGNEVHLVAARRELNTELGRNHSAAAIGRITRDADFHCLTSENISKTSPLNRRSLGSLGMTKETPGFPLKAAADKSGLLSKRLLSSNHFLWKRHPPLCHPERSRGIRGSADLSW